MNYWLVDFINMVIRDIKSQWTKGDSIFIFLGVYAGAIAWLVKYLLS